MKPNYLIPPIPFSALVLFGTLLSQTNPALSQITPDNTLGAESSVVNPRDEASDSIEGGALRGQNLFHSFQEFNVDAGRDVYFANPDAVNNIFSRVTGDNVSNILGTLGVDGAADLYLINPNGIIFGENSSLDVQGSFTATTADGIEFTEGSLFSAVAPGESLLTISVPLGLQFGSNPGNIINQGNLVTGQDLTLDANNLDLQGQILAGENLTLSALDTVKIRDSADNPFIGAARGNLLIRGNQKVDIFTLSHPQSGLFSGQDLVVQSANPVDGDANFWSGGNFSIEQLDGNLGNLNSPRDPIIRSFGDVNFNNYGGSSLHILAGGSVTIGIIFIDRLETEIEGTDFIKETIQLSNGDEVSIDGSQQPTLDIRAGVNPNQIIASGITGENTTIDNFFNDFVQERPNLANVPTSANITINSISMVGENGSDGLVLLTNQYEANSSLPGGTIEIDTITTGDNFIALPLFGFTGKGGSVIIDSRDNILVNDLIDSSSNSGSSGNITLLAKSNINLFDGTRIDASLEGEGTGGNILIEAQGILSLTGSTPDQTANIFSNIITSGIGQGGNIDIKASSLFLNNSLIDATTFGQGDAGKISIIVDDTITLQNSIIFNNSEQGGVGNTGGIAIEAETLSLKDNSDIFNRLESPIFVEGGGIKIDVDSLSLESNSIIDNGVFGQGQSGDILINVESLSLSGASQILSGVFGQGQAGDIIISANNSVSLEGDARFFEPDFATGILNRIQPGGEGSAGNITINTNSLSISGAQLSASVQGEGNAGNISIQAKDSIAIFNESGIFSSVDSGAEGSGGEINIDSKSLSIDDGSQILAIVRGASELSPLPGKGNAGNININTSDTLTISGILLEDGFTTGFIASSVASGAEGIGGDINIKAGNLILNNFASLTSSLDLDATGKAGNINIEADSLSLNSAQITAVTEGKGNAGNISITAGEFISLLDSGIGSLAFFNAVGDGGDIQIETPSLLLKGNSFINTSTSVEGEGGDINLNAFDITLRNDSDFATFVLSGEGGGGNITLTADSIIAFDDSDIFAFAEDGQGGNITLNTPAFFAENFTLNSLTSDPNTLENNNRADVNATGAISGAVDIPDVSFIQNSLTELPDNSINTDELVANSCVVPARESEQGTFIITGGDSLPVRPGGNLPSKYPTGEVRSVSENNTSSWQPGDPIVEPQGVYRLASGKLVLSRECSSK